MRIFIIKIVILGLLSSGILQAGQDEVVTMSFLKEHSPEIHADILSLEDYDSEGYKISLEEAAVAAKEYERLLKLGEPETAAAYLKMYQIDYKAIVVADQIVMGDDKVDKKRLEEELRRLIDLSFTQWVIVEGARVKRLERQVEALRKDLEDTVTNREDVVDRDVQVLLQETRDFRKKN